MPTIIAQGSQQTVILPAGATLAVAGTGTAQVYAPQRPSVATPQLPTSSAGTSIGPFDCDSTVRLVATSALSYDVLGSGDVLSRSGRLAFTAAGVQALVSGAGNLFPRHRAKLSAVAAGVSDAIMVIAGDSTVAAAYGSGQIWNGCAAFSQGALLTAALRARGVRVSNDAWFGQGNSGPANGYDSRVTFTNWGGLNDGNPGGLSGGLYRSDNAQVSAVNFQCESTCDTINVLYLTNAGAATFDILINGEASLLAVTPSATLGIAVATLSVPRGVHRISIQRRAGAGFFAIFAVYASDSANRRVIVWNWGAGGAPINIFTDNSATFSPAAQAALLAPNISFIALQSGINNMIVNQLGSVAPATAKANAVIDYQAFVNTFRPNSDVVFITPTPIALAQASLLQQDAVLQACREVARDVKNVLPTVDNAALFFSKVFATTLGYFNDSIDAAGVHPIGPGYVAMSANLQSVSGLS